MRTSFRTFLINAFLLLTLILSVGCGGQPDSDPETSAATPSSSAPVSAHSFSGITAVVNTTNTSTELQWTAVTEAKGYVVFNTTASGTPLYVKFVEAPASGTIITGLTANTSYSFRVRLVDEYFYQDANEVDQPLTTTSAPPDQLLDTITGSAAVLSLRKLNNTYSGPAIKVRRDSDNLSVDIGFSGYDLDETALNAHLSGANGFIEVWYDQSGGGHNATQTTLAYQPQIILAATANSKATIRFDGSDDLLHNPSVSYSARTAFFKFSASSASQSTAQLAQLWGSYGEGVQAAIDPRSGSSMSFDGSGSGTAIYSYDSNAYSASFEANPSGSGWAYNTFHTLAVEFNSANSLTAHTLGSLYPAFSVGAHQFGGDISEVIIFDDTKTSGERATIEANIGAYY